MSSPLRAPILTGDTDRDLVAVNQHLVRVAAAGARETRDPAGDWSAFVEELVARLGDAQGWLPLPWPTLEQLDGAPAERQGAAERGGAGALVTELKPDVGESE